MRAEDVRAPMCGLCDPPRVVEAILPHLATEHPNDKARPTSA